MEPRTVSKEQINGMWFVVLHVLVRTTNRFRTEYRINGRKVNRQAWEAARAAA